MLELPPAFPEREAAGVSTGGLVVLAHCAAYGSGIVQSTVDFTATQ